MQKSRIANIIIIIIISIYTLFAINHSFISNKLYSYVINPLFWIILASILFVFMKGIYKKKLKKEIINYSAIAALAYIAITLLSGLFVTFGKNPYATTLRGFLTNLWIFRKCNNI
ncbi:MAG: hypothetical protein FWF46_05275 [Oscillospiraceae bacterium]|nr:hypothetical protein [Oscillospiraceae bacterium]